jgi:GT2 family glycosyltransferase/SAM-dependent methyltransferase/glycosyltransferase involved in cell wall biosynthesis
MADDPALPLIASTGERFARTVSETEVELEHVHRYRAAAAICYRKRVLDAASGEGYGTAMLAASGAQVVGLELDKMTVEAARLRYPGLDFRQGDVTRLPFDDAEFDVITSFETLEHVPDPHTALDEFRRVLKPDGVLVISTPERGVYNRHLAEPNRFHLYEMGREEFRRELENRFRYVSFYGQRVVFGSLFVAPMGGRLETARREPSGAIIEQNSFDSAMYLIAACSNARPPELPQGLYEGGVPQNAMSSVLGGIEDRDRELRALRAATASQPDEAAAAAAAALAREAEAAQAALARARAEVDESERRLRLAEAQTEAIRRDSGVTDLARSLAEAQDALKAALSERVEVGRLLQDLRRRAAEGSQHAAVAGDALAALHDQFARARPRSGGPGAWLGDLMAVAKRRGRAPRAALRMFLSLRALRRSGLLVESYYARGRPDLAGVDLVRHYFFCGVAESRDPSPLFSNAAYLAAYPEVARHGLNPLAHYARFGRAQGWEAAPNAAVAGLPQFREPRCAEAPAETPQSVRQAPRQAEPWARHGWRAADDPRLRDDELEKYDVRPDDAAPREARRGATFLAEHRLLESNPDFSGAIEALNVRPTGCVSAQDGAVPDVSVIIPVHGQLAYTLNCLDALLSHEAQFSFEVIVVDDASPDASAAHLPMVRGVRHHRLAENGGFIRACNAGADLARAPLLVLLNNDTRVVAGWLDELVSLIRRNPKVGLAGSKLFYPDASLQEAGGIIWSDGSAWNLGRHDDPNRPEYCYARPVDYVSGASIAIPAEVWRSLGGFDERYCPAYCEDSDFALRLRQHGLEAWLQPLSRVIHYEGQTCGTDLQSGVKQHQVRNSELLFERWRETLASHRPTGSQPWLEKDRAAARRVLVLDETAPTPDQDAGSVTAIKVMQVFQQLGYKVVFAPVDNFLYQRKYIGDLQRMGVECLYAPFCLDLDAHLKQHGANYDVVHIFRHDVMRRTIDSVRAHCPRAMVMFNNMDLHYLRLQRQAEVEGGSTAEALSMKATELQTMARADLIFVPSTYERDLLRAEDIGPPVEVMPFMVDREAPITAAAKAEDIVFLGGFRHPPNVDAVLWFHSEIWPAVLAARPRARFVVVGAHPTEEILALQSDRFIVTGRLDDLRPAFETARVFVAPIRYGAGVKGKVYTAMSYGAPVVTTSVGAEGIGLRPGLDALVADTPEGLAADIVRVFEDAALEQRLRLAGPAFIEQNATLDAGCRAMLAAMDKAVAPIGGQLSARA